MAMWQFLVKMKKKLLSTHLVSSGLVYGHEQRRYNVECYGNATDPTPTRGSHDFLLSYRE